jgi:hypothetical protein
MTATGSGVMEKHSWMWRSAAAMAALPFPFSECSLLAPELVRGFA